MSTDAPFKNPNAHPCRQRSLLGLLAFPLLLLLPVFAPAAPATLDASFGTGGKVATDPPGSSSLALVDVVVQADGGILAASCPSSALTFLRYLPNGSPDPAFHGTGALSVSLQGNTRATGMAVQPDGKIMVAAYRKVSGPFSFPAPTDENDLVVLRFNADGSPDATWGGTGVVTMDLGTGSAFPTSIAIQPDNRIVVAGRFEVSSGGSELFLARFLADGTLDADFNGTGKVLPPIDGMPEHAIKMALQADGKILISGYIDSGYRDIRRCFLQRYHSDGSLDSGFNSTGRAILPDGIDALNFALQSDGKSVSVGTAVFNGIDADAALVRLNADGTLDGTFGGTGVVRSPLNATSHDSGVDVAIQEDGRIVMACHKSAGTSFGFVRYHPDGSLDTSINGTEPATTFFATPSGLTSPTVQKVLLQSDRKILLAGFAGSISNSHLVMARFMGGSSPVVTTASASSLSVTGATLQGTVRPNGLPTSAYIEWGTTTGYGERMSLNITDADSLEPQEVSATLTGLTPGTRYYWRLVAVNADGTETSSNGTFTTTAPGDIDATFSRVTTKFSTSLHSSAQSRDMAVQSDGKILLVGNTTELNVPAKFAIARYEANGSLDASFGAGGKVMTSFSTGKAGGECVAVQGDGKIVVAGNADVATESRADFALARYLADGSLDLSFGVGGTLTTTVGPVKDAFCSCLAIQPDGKILAGGTHYRKRVLSSGIYLTEMALVRYLPDGQLDGSFGDGGMVFTSFGGPSNWASGVAVQPDGKIILVGGNSLVAGLYNTFAMARYLPNGKLDPAFGKKGKVLGVPGVPKNLLSTSSGASEVILQSDGKFLVCGTLHSLTVARYLPNGTLDKTFNRSGLATSLGWSANLAQHPDGSILVAGSPLLTSFTSHGTLNEDLGVRPTGAIHNLSPISSPTIDVAAIPDGGILVADGQFKLARLIGSVPQVEITCNGQWVPSGDTTPSVSEGTDFGAVAAGGGSVTRTFTVSNRGLQPLTLRGIAPDYVETTFFNAFQVTQQPAAGIIAPGASESFTVTFAPTMGFHLGAQTATITLRSNDRDDGVYTFQVAGKGVNDTLKPTLLVAAPGGSRVSGPVPFIVRGTAADRYGIRRVSVVLNGVSADAVLGQPASPAATAVPWSLPVTPQAGANTLLIIARDFRNNMTATQRNFHFTPR